MSYRTRLAAIDDNLSRVTPVAARLILLTGQSSFLSSRLLPTQADFLRAVAPSGVEPLLMGLPYHADFDCCVPPPSLLIASIRNTLQVCWSMCSAGYRHSVARALQRVIENTDESLYIVTGSCGLQILASAWPMLIVPNKPRLRVVALGPTLLRAGSFPVDRVRVLQGRRDFWSRLLYRGPLEARCNNGHMDYWSSADVRELVARLLDDDQEAS